MDLLVSGRGAARLAGTVVLGTVIGLGAWSLAAFRRATRSRPSGQRFGGLVTAGPYRFSRHPNYLSLLLDYLGETGIFSELRSLVLLLVAFVYLDFLVIATEERALRRRSGYEAYRTRVRRRVGTR